MNRLLPLLLLSSLIMVVMFWLQYSSDLNSLWMVPLPKSSNVEGDLLMSLVEVATKSGLMGWSSWKISSGWNKSAGMLVKSYCWFRVATSGYDCACAGSCVQYESRTCGCW